jgi:tetratricopeptide (TPR) repeat protein
LLQFLLVLFQHPNGIILSANNVELEDNNTFSKVIFLDLPFYEESGKYSATLDYGKDSVELNFEIDNGITVDASESIIEEIIPEIIFMESSQATYYDDDFVEINGKVSSAEESSVLIGIFDTFGMPAGFYFGEINTNNEFSVSFLAKSGVNFKTEGTYSAKAFYEDSESEISFDFSNNKPLFIEEVEEEIIEETSSEHDFLEEETVESIEEHNDDSQKNNDLSEDDIVETKNNEEIIPIEQNTQSTPKVIEKIPPKQNVVEKPQTKQETNNLSVEDVALGIMLNQMVLNCDTSEYNDFVSYYDGMGPALMRLCKYDEALSFFDQELEDEPNNLKILTNKGAVLSKLGLNQESTLYYDAALDLESKYLPALNNKANALAQLGNWNEALSIYNNALELYPGNNLLIENLNKAQEHIPKFIESPNKSQNSIQQITTNVVEKTISAVKDVNERPSNVIEEIGIVFSTFSAMIFGFLN